MMQVFLRPRQKIPFIRVSSERLSVGGEGFGRVSRRINGERHHAQIGMVLDLVTDLPELRGHPWTRAGAGREDEVRNPHFAVEPLLAIERATALVRERVEFGNE